MSGVWHCIPVVPALGELRQEECEVEPDLNLTYPPLYPHKGGREGERERGREGEKQITHSNLFTYQQLHG